MAPVPVPTEPLLELKLSCPAEMTPKLPFTMFALAVRSTVPVPPLALSEPAKFKPAPDDFMFTLPAEAVIDELPLELSAPEARASKSPVALALVPLKFNALVLFKKTPVAALAVTLAVLTVNRLAPVPVPIDPLVEVRLS